MTALSAYAHILAAPGGSPTRMLKPCAVELIPNAWATSGREMFAVVAETDIPTLTCTRVDADVDSGSTAHPVRVIEPPMPWPG